MNNYGRAFTSIGTLVVGTWLFWACSSNDSTGQLTTGGSGGIIEQEAGAGGAGDSSDAPITDASSDRSSDTSSNDAQVTFQPTAIPYSDPEINNPWRGEYDWQGNRIVPASYPWPTSDNYLRISWRDLEPSKGTYDFTALEDMMQEARSSGGKFGFRIVAAR